MDFYKLTLGVLGLVLIGSAWLPHLLRRRLLTFPIVYVAIGFAIYNFSLELPFADANPRAYKVGTERLTELVVLIAASKNVVDTFQRRCRTAQQNRACV